MATKLGIHEDRVERRDLFAVSSRLIFRILPLWLLVTIAMSCSVSSRLETTASTSSDLFGCSATASTPLAYAGFDSNATATVNPGTPFYIPATVNVTASPYLMSLTGTVTFTGTGISCTYFRSFSGQDSTPLPFVSCSNAAVPGQTVTDSGFTLTTHLSGFGDDIASLSVTIQESIDDGNPCTVDACTGGLITRTAVLAGPVNDGNQCAVDICDGSKNPPTPHPIPKPTDACRSYPSTCDPATGWLPLPGNNCQPPNVPDYPGNGQVTSDVSAAAAWLYTSGPQTGVNTTLMDTKRLSILRGRATTATQTPSPIVAATVSIVGHPEFGQTTTGNDGYYEMAVNGGPTYVVQVVAGSYVTSQRHVQTYWRDWSVAPDIAMVSKDVVNPVTANLGSWQVARGTQMSDGDGIRRATLLIPPNTVANGVTGTTYSMRATEFTASPQGAAAMPGDLPASSGYTYAVEFAIDEAEAQSVSPVTFTNSYGNSVVAYLENFIGTPVAADSTGIVPNGSYDRSSGKWVEEPSGRAVKIIGKTQGSPSLAQLSVDGTTEMTYGTISDGERQQLALLYPTNALLWRVPIQHFTPYDMNWGFGLPSDAIDPPSGVNPVEEPALDDPTTCHGSILECENQVLGEALPIVGTPYSLHYRSATQAGYIPVIKVPVTDNTALPPSLLGVEVDLNVAGRPTAYQFASPTLNNFVRFAWDGIDADGKEVQGRVTAHITVSYLYGGVKDGYQATSSFGAFGEGVLISGNRKTRIMKVSRNYDITVERFDVKRLGLGGWTVSAQHVYEPLTNKMWLGDGTQRLQTNDPAVFSSVFTDGDSSHWVSDVAVTPDGTLYVAHDSTTDAMQQYLGKIVGSAIQTVSLPSTNYTTVSFTDNAPISTVTVRPKRIATLPDGNLLIVEARRLVRLNVANNTLSLVAGKYFESLGTGAYTPDGQVAKGAFLNLLRDATPLPDGSIAFIEYDNGAVATYVRRVTPGGLLETIVGDITTTAHGGMSPGCVSVPCGATKQNLHTTNSLAAATDGSIYFDSVTSDIANACRVWQLTPYGTVRLAAGNGVCQIGQNDQNSGDGSLAPQAPTGFVGSLSIADGLLLADPSSRIVRRVDTGGTVTLLAGNRSPSSPPFASGDPVTRDYFGIAGTTASGRTVLGPDGYYYVLAGTTIARFRKAGDWSSGGNYLVPRPDGSELYQFDATGRHTDTLSPTRGTQLLHFAYDNTGRLSQIVNLAEPTHSTTTFTYGLGTVTISGEYGQQTILTLNGDGYVASVQNPNGETTQLSYLGTGTGLLTQLTDPKGQVHTFGYSFGYLKKDASPISGAAGKQLTRTETFKDYSVDVTSPEGRVVRHNLDGSPSSLDPYSIERLTHTVDPGDGTHLNLVTKDDRHSDGTQTLSLPDGTVVTSTMSGDPRYGFAAPFASATTTTTGTHTLSTCATRAATWSGSSGPTSMTAETDNTYVGCTCGSCGSVSPYTTAFSVVNGVASVTTTTPGQRQVKRILDSQERVTEVDILGTNPVSLVPTYFDYDTTTGRLSAVRHGASGRTNSVTVDPMTGYVSSMSSPLTSVSFTARDAVGRPKTVNLPGNTRNVLSSYDLNGNLATLTLPQNNGQHGFASNGEDLPSAYQPPGPNTPLTYGYDFDGLLTSVSALGMSGDPAYTYDAASRLSTVTYGHPVSGTVSVSNTYDRANGQTSLGHLMTVSATNGPYATTLVTNAYDGALKTSEKSSGAWPNATTHSVDYTYDSRMRVSTRSVDSGLSITYGYDADDLVSSVALPSDVYAICRGTQSGSCNTVGSNGLVGGSSFGNVYDHYTYNSYGEVTAYMVTIGPTAGGTVLYSADYGTRDALGRITQRNETVNGLGCNWSYQFDPGPNSTNTNSFVTSATSTGSCGFGSGSWNYDANGNLYPQWWSYDAQDRLTYSGWTYTLDAWGNHINQTNGTTNINFQYDALGNMRRYSDGGATNIRYLVDGLNRRIAKVNDTSGALIQGYLYEGNRIIATVDENNTVNAHFVYATKPNVPDVMIAYNGSSWVDYRIISDQLGSVRLIVDSAGNVPAGGGPFFYETWGLPSGLTVPKIHNEQLPFAWAGGLWDNSSNLYHFGARDYNPWVARWWSKDPIGFNGGIDVYGYCQNDPVNCIDPSGLAGAFVWGALEAHTPLEHLGVESVGLFGYDTNTGFYNGLIGAVSVHGGGEANYLGVNRGIENIVSGPSACLTGKTEDITLAEVGVGPEVPEVAGFGGLFGFYATSAGEWGYYGGIQGGALGQNAAAGVGAPFPEFVSDWLNELTNGVFGIGAPRSR